ncbi:hypothetical protein [Kitasatospora sp. GP82]|uniref:hypothetical protein n=1 Tax=Kitasatospora sp. GP82 TaxID=3035089 RepID=UPI0024732B7A|nr:hypothetical protein [Kitasatospora sp. GP82]
MAADDVGNGHAEIDDTAAGRASVELGGFLLGSGAADPQPLDLAEPAFAPGFGDAGDEAVTDVDQPCPLGRIWSEE